MKLKGKAKAAFLRRMAKGRNQYKTTKTKKRSTPVAKKRRGRHHTKSGRKSRRRTHGGMGKWVPDHQKLVAFASAFAYGKVEAAASKDPQHALNKVPPVIAQIGRAGNLGAGAWIAGVITRHPIIKAVASGLITVAAYQNGRGSGFTKDAPDFKMSGPGRRRDEMLVEEYLRRQGAR